MCQQCWLAFIDTLKDYNVGRMVFLVSNFGLTRRKKQITSKKFKRRSERVKWYTNVTMIQRVQDGSRTCALFAWAWRAWDEEIKGKKQSSPTALKFAQFLLKVEKWLHQTPAEPYLKASHRQTSYQAVYALTAQSNLSYHLMNDSSLLCA